MIRSRLIGHSCQAIARVNMRLTSASLCSGGPATPRTRAATARSGSTQSRSAGPLNTASVVSAGLVEMLSRALKAVSTDGGSALFQGSDGAALEGGSPGLVGGHWVGQQRDAPHQRLGCIHRPGIWHAGGSEKVVEPPAALQGVVDRSNERWPPPAGLEGVGSVGADELSQPCGPGRGEGMVRCRPGRRPLG